jgi:hypothetical protein
MSNTFVWVDIPVANLDRSIFRAVIADSEGNRVALHSMTA